MIRTHLIAPALLSALLSLGCASSLKMAPPIRTEAALGRVVIYRNGVAYFQRRATVKGNELRLSVPSERVDDFLKSLTVVDARTGRPVPISFPTPDGGGEIAIQLELPKDEVHELAITYVTESPSWKPSYRIELQEAKRARLEAWAVVHNVSGEDWKHVTVGVGSTSALSFKYDLRSVHFVQRETLSDDSALGAAPPTGGSPYRVAASEVQLLGDVSVEALTPAVAPEAQQAMDQSEDGEKVSKPGAPKMSAPAVRRGAGLGKVAERARATKQKIRIEGFASPTDKDKWGASLANANRVRDGLVNNGVPLEQIEIVPTGQASQGEAARVVAVEAPVGKPSQPLATTEEPLGDAYFLAPAPLDVEKDHSAMVNVLTTPTRAEPVYFYDPISARGSTRFAFRAVLIENPTEYTLDSGPVTVYAAGQFLGEGLTEAIPPKSRAFVPFSLDKKVLVETKESGREEIDRLVTAQRGVLTTEARAVHTTELVLVNRGTSSATVYVRHAPAGGTRLESPKTGFEKLRGAYLFQVSVPANGSTTLRIEEATPIQKSVDIRTPSGIGDLKLYLKSAAVLEPQVKARLEQIVAMHRSMAELEERIRTAQLQMETYRERIDELNTQLVSLRRVQQAQVLSRNLADKMEELSQRLQKLTIQVADHEGQRLAERVALEDRLAELTLEKSEAPLAVKH